jgi:hypothetical protein
MQSRTAVVVPFNHPILFVRLLTRTKVSRRASRNCPNPGRDLQDLVPIVVEAVGRVMASLRDLSQESLPGMPVVVAGSAQCGRSIGCIHYFLCLRRNRSLLCTHKA